jgi:hypothetical protein
MSNHNQLPQFETPIDNSYAVNPDALVEAARQHEADTSAYEAEQAALAEAAAKQAAEDARHEERKAGVQASTEAFLGLHDDDGKLRPSDEIAASVANFKEYADQRPSGEPGEVIHGFDAVIKSDTEKHRDELINEAGEAEAAGNSTRSNDIVEELRNRIDSMTYVSDHEKQRMFDAQMKRIEQIRDQAVGVGEPKPAAAPEAATQTAGPTTESEPAQAAQSAPEAYSDNPTPDEVDKVTNHINNMSADEFKAFYEGQNLSPEDFANLPARVRLEMLAKMNGNPQYADDLDAIVAYNEQNQAAPEPEPEQEQEPIPQPVVLPAQPSADLGDGRVRGYDVHAKLAALSAARGGSSDSSDDGSNQSAAAPAAPAPAPAAQAPQPASAPDNANFAGFTRRYNTDPNAGTPLPGAASHDTYPPRPSHEPLPATPNTGNRDNSLDALVASGEHEEEPAPQKSRIRRIGSRLLDWAKVRTPEERTNQPLHRPPRPARAVASGLHNFVRNEAVDRPLDEADAEEQGESTNSTRV